jgi:alpha-methylacyl-CoA racemase
MSLTGLDGDDQLAKQMDPTQWPALKVWITEPFKTKTRDEWCAPMEMADVCFAPSSR